MIVTAAIVTYNNSESMLKKVLESLSNDITVNKIFIIDNSSATALEVITTGFDRVEYIHLPENLGFGQAHNVGFTKALEFNSTYHFVVNPDIYFNENVIKDMVNFMGERPEIGVSMPKVLYPNGKIQRLCKQYPTPLDLIFRRFLPNGKLKQNIDYKYEMHYFDYDSIAEIPVLSGCFMCINIEVLKSGIKFDKRYFMYLEDFDFCRTIRDTGWKLFYNPQTTVIHEFAKGSHRNFKLMRYHISSAMSYFNKWGWFFDRKRKEINVKAQKGEL